MIDVPMAEWLDDRICTLWLERHLQPRGLECPGCGGTARRLFRPPRYLPASRGRGCNGYDTLLTGTAFEKTRQRPAALVLLRRGIAKGEPTARLARELGLSRMRLPTLRQRVHTNLNHTAPTELMTGTTCEADARYQNAGETKPPTACPS